MLARTEPQTEAEIIARYKAARARLNPPRPQAPFSPMPTAEEKQVETKKPEEPSIRVKATLEHECAPAWVVNKVSFWPLLVPPAKYVADPHVNSILKILKMVSRATDISTTEICSKRRTGAVVTTRQIVMYLCRHHTHHSLPEIGRRLGNRDHTTVLHGVRQIERKRKMDAALDETLKCFETSLAKPE